MDGIALFTVAEARATLAELMPTLTRVIEIRADAAELGRALSPGGPPSALGGRTELQALQDTLEEGLRVIQATGVVLKGIAPLLLDFPSTFEGETVLLCWLEGDLGLSWYHRADLGFAGRRSLPFDA